ncbi:MAG: hypothetical protein RBU37_01285 [Myxococcota bacterium]|nr:hypothetical protein [Myxococcota bacterium]
MPSQMELALRAQLDALCHLFSQRIAQAEQRGTKDLPVLQAIAATLEAHRLRLQQADEALRRAELALEQSEDLPSAHARLSRWHSRWRVLVELVIEHAARRLDAPPGLESSSGEHLEHANKLRNFILMHKDSASLRDKAVSELKSLLDEARSQSQSGPMQPLRLNAARTQLREQLIDASAAVLRATEVVGMLYGYGSSDYVGLGAMNEQS